ncbi:MAG: YdgA family protein [Chromatiaceae bacterium]|nr:YdgA family protein [Chromatiaceae bacterium]
MKKIAVLTLIVLALVLGTPAIIGFRAETHYQMMIERIQHSGAKVISHRYQRGWFVSDAETRLRFALPDEAAIDTSEGLQLTLVSTVTHGPLLPSGVGLAEAESHLKFADQAIFPPGYPDSVNTTIDFNGSGRTSIDLPAAEIAGSMGRPDLSFGGLSGEIGFDVERGALDIRLLLKQLVVGNTGNRSVNLTGAQVISNFATGSSGLMLGSAEFSAQQLALGELEGGEQVGLYQPSIQLNSSERSDQVSTVVSYAFEKLEAGRAVYGPGQLQIELNRLSAPVLQRLQRETEEIRDQKLSDAARSLALMGVATNFAGELLQNDPELKIAPLRLVTPQGTLQGELSLRSKGLSLLDLANITLLVSKLDATMSLSIPEELLRMMLKARTNLLLEQQLAESMEQGGAVPELDQDQLQELVELQVDEQLNNWLSQQFLTREGGDLVVVASLSSGSLIVNGRTLPLTP